MTELICIVCPKGCRIQTNPTIRTFTGHGCEKGAEYARTELENPVRILTGTVKLLGGSLSRCPVRSSIPIPKQKLPDAMAVLSGLTLTAPVQIGQVVLENFLDTGADLIVTRNID